MAEYAKGWCESWFATNSKDMADHFRPFLTGKFNKPRELSHTWEYYIRVLCNDTEDDTLYGLYQKWEEAIVTFALECGIGFEYAFSSGVGIDG